MPLTIGLGFATEHVKEAFIERALPKLHAKSVEPPPLEGEETDGLHRLGVAITSPSGAKELCSQIVSFLTHQKGARVNLVWTGADGQLQTGLLESGAAREAELIALRLSAAVKHDRVTG